MAIVVPKREQASVVVPSPDGYHFADDHAFDADDRDKLVKELKVAHESLLTANGKVRALLADLSAAQRRVSDTDVC